MHPYFKLIGIEPGRVHTSRFGTLDFRGEVDVEILKQLVDSGFPYLKLSPEGRKTFYPSKIVDKVATPKVQAEIIHEATPKAKKNERKSRKVG